MKINDQIHKWLEDTVIGLNLCPFAKEPFDTKQIYFRLSSSRNFKNAFEDFVQELTKLNNSIKFKTTLITYENLECDFEQFNNFCGLLEESLKENHLDTIFQIVCFHPQFKFEGVDFSDKANYVNRSPAPIVHILKKQDMDAATIHLQSGENISYINEKTIKSLSEKQLKKYFWYL